MDDCQLGTERRIRIHVAFAEDAPRRLVVSCEPQFPPLDSADPSSERIYSLIQNSAWPSNQMRRLTKRIGPVG